VYSGCQVSFPGVKRPGRGVDHPPTSGEVKERLELQPNCPSGPSWPVLALTLHYCQKIDRLFEETPTASTGSRTSRAADAVCSTLTFGGLVIAETVLSITDLQLSANAVSKAELISQNARDEFKNDPSTREFF
jgi:hypothetical protein